MRGGTCGSSLGQPLDNARAHVLPRFTGRFAVHHTSRPSFDFMGPRGFDFGSTLCRRLVEAGQQLGGHVGAFFNGQRQGLTKNVLRSRRHEAILDPAGQPNKRLHPGCLIVVPP